MQKPEPVENNENEILAAASDSEAASSAAPELPLSPTEIEELKKQVAKAKEHWETLLRTTADFENFKKRAAREKQDTQRYAFEPLLTKLIPVLDNFDMAMQAVSAAQDKAVQSLQTGIAMIHQQFRAVLLDAGLEEIDAAGKTFDPTCHEAVSQQESVDVPEGQVVQQVRKGYRFRDRLLRPASVIVAKKPASS